MISISQTALKELNRLQAKQKSHAFLRIDVRPGGCSDWLYILELDDMMRPDDRVQTCEGIQVVVAQQALGYINGMLLDYSEDLMGGGFRFHNPNAAKHCGCGNSFSIDKEVAQQLPLLETE